MRFWAWAFWPMVLALAGCTSLDAVRTASTKLVTASKSWGDVGGELNASCVRQQQFNRALADCDQPAAASQGLVGANTVLTSYFQALGDAASDQNFTVDPGLGALAQSAAGIPGIDKAQVSAASDLARLIAKWALAAAREKALRELISEGVPPSERVLDALDQHVTRALQTTLSQERLEVDATYLRYIYPNGGVSVSDLSGLCATAPPAYRFNDGPSFLLAQDYCRRVADLNAKTKALGAYQQSLSSAKQTLDDLASSKADLSSKALISQLYDMGKDLDAKVEAVEKAFPKGAN